MSPFSTFINCGSSSMLVERTNLPTFVRRCASGSRFPSASRSSVMVLNLMTLKILASFPGLFWKKNAPAPLLAKWSQIVTTSNMGLMQISTMSEIQKSRNRLKKCLYIKGKQQKVTSRRSDHQLYKIIIKKAEGIKYYFPNRYLMKRVETLSISLLSYIYSKVSSMRSGVFCMTE